MSGRSDSSPAPTTGTRSAAELPTPTCRSEYSEPGTRVDILYFNERYATRVVEEPLYDPKGARMRV